MHTCTYIPLLYSSPFKKWKPIHFKGPQGKYTLTMTT